MANQHDSWSMNELKPNDDASKVDGASIIGAAPPDAGPIFYQGQKITLSVTTSGLKSANYTKATFQLNNNDDLSPFDGDPPLGLVVHPDSQSKITQNVSSDSETYSLNAVVLGTASTNDYDYTEWNIAIEGGLQGPLQLNGVHAPDGDYSYFTKAVYVGPGAGIRQISGGTTGFTSDAGKAVHVIVQVMKVDAKTSIAQQFSGYVQAGTGDLTNFQFWDGVTHTQLSPIDTKTGAIVWVDSSATGEFDFYITSNLTSGGYSDTLSMTIGTAEPEIVQIIVGDTLQISESSRLPVPVPADGVNLKLDSSHTIFDIDVPRLTFPNAILPGDTLVLCLNDAILPSSFYTVPDDYTGGAIRSCFAVSAASWKSTVAGYQNTLQYVLLRGRETVTSGEKPVTVSGSSGGGNNDPQPYVRVYGRPAIVEDPGYLDLDYERVQAGLTVKISWDPNNWKPKLGDVLNLYVDFNAANISGAPMSQVTSIPYPAIQQADLDNQYIQQLIDYKVFAGFLGGTVFMQYSVPANPANLGQPGYSVPTPTMGINTVPPGGL